MLGLLDGACKKLRAPAKCGSREADESTRSEKSDCWDSAPVAKGQCKVYSLRKSDADHQVFTKPSANCNLFAPEWTMKVSNFAALRGTLAGKCGGTSAIL